MRKLVTSLAVATSVILMAAAAEAACYADYKAKKDNPLQLHYGVVEIPDSACGNNSAAAAEIGRRIGKAGWQLLNVVSTFGPEGLDQRKNSAGEYFLRF